MVPSTPSASSSGAIAVKMNNNRRAVDCNTMPAPFNAYPDIGGYFRIFRVKVHY
jgi:hypothetical protein